MPYLSISRRLLEGSESKRALHVISPEYTSLRTQKRQPEIGLRSQAMSTPMRTTLVVSTSPA